MEKELELAHQEYEERKEWILAKLRFLSDILRPDPAIPDVYAGWIDTAIDFIKEKEI